MVQSWQLDIVDSLYIWVRAIRGSTLDVQTVGQIGT